LEATRCTEVDEQTVVHPHDRIKLSVKKKWATKPWKDMEKVKCVLFSERSQSARAIWYMIPTTWYSGESKITDTLCSEVFSG
jgi:hypothetical protein